MKYVNDLSHLKIIHLLQYLRMSWIIMFINLYYISYFLKSKRMHPMDQAFFCQHFANLLIFDNGLLSKK